MDHENRTENRAVFFFDIDNCLYARSKNVHAHMATLITKYFVDHLNLTTEEAVRLHQEYYQSYGLAVEGLSRFHQIAPLDFNREVDDALPLDDLLHPDPELRSILESFDKTKVKLWLFTNAHVTHGLRVVRILGIEDLFEGITYCDYSIQTLVPKPLPDMFAKAEREAGISDYQKIYFIDDHHLNCQAAFARGWSNTVHLLEPDLPIPPSKPCENQISHLRELLVLYPKLLNHPRSSSG